MVRLDKKGNVDLDTLLPWIIALGVIGVFAFALGVASGKLDGVASFFKGFLHIG
ncbi:MAG: hypothetical protein AABX66_00560 [Nanoarchaeota archaeon]